MSDTTNETTEANLEDAKPNKSAWTRQVTALGEREGMGSNSRPGLFLHITEGARRKFVDNDDVPGIFDRYTKAVADKQKIGWAPQASAKQQVSKFRIAVKLGQLVQVDGEDVVRRTFAAQEAERTANEGKLNMSPLDGLVAVGRMQLAYPDTPLTDETIADVLAYQPDAPDKSEADLLDALATKIDKWLKAEAEGETEISETTQQILDASLKAFVQRVKDLGGTTAQQKREAKEQAKLDAVKSKVAELRVKRLGEAAEQAAA